jgi:hypothetical protein
MYPRVLVAYDGSARSLSVRPVAAAAARAFGSQLDVIHVTGPDASPPDLDEPDLRIVEAADPTAGLIQAVCALPPHPPCCASPPTVAGRSVSWSSAASLRNCSVGCTTRW